MPILDVTLPVTALADDEKTQLADQLARSLLKYEGYPDPSPARLSTTWVYLNEIKADAYTVGGALHLEQHAPRYRVKVTVPQGVLSDEAKTGLVGEITQTLLALEGQAPSLEGSLRVYCLVDEVPDGNWGTAGRILRLADMIALAKASAAK